MNQENSALPIRPGPTGPQMARLMRLIEWLRSGRPLTQKRAASMLHVSPRTIATDLDYLRQFGVPLAFDRRKNTYYLTESFSGLPLISLRRTEWAAFLVARHALEVLGDSPHAQLLETVTRRLADFLPETVQLEPDTLARTIRFDAGPGPKEPLAHLEVLSQAIDNQQVIRLHYHANNRNEETEREVEPYHLLWKQGRGYLIAYCRLRRAMRDFRIDRIRTMEIGDEVFARDPSFDLDEYLGPAFGMHRGERTYAVHIRFSAYQARWIREEQWHPSQIMTRRPDGTLDVRMQVAGLADVARWVLSYGGEAEVISPPVLRHRVAREARRLAMLYEGVGPVDKPEDA